MSNHPAINIEAVTRSERVSRPIRVGHLIHTMAHGGVETALINWFKTFNPERVEAHLACFANPGETERPFLEAAARANLAVATVPWTRYKPILRAARETASWIRENDIEILHCHNTYANIVGLLAAKMEKIKAVTTIYVWSGFGIKRMVLQWLDERLLRYFDQITAHCESARQATIQRGFKAEELELLTCGFSERVVNLTQDERIRQRSALGIRPDQTVLIKVARFWPEKRHDVLLRAFRLLLDKASNCRLWIPGVGPDESKLKELADELGISSYCSFLGFRADLPELLALADIQVHSSDEEGVPLAILSGMAAGLPIVSTRVGGIPEVITHDVSGVFVDKGDSAALAEAVYNLIDDRERRNRLGANAKTFIEREYSLAAATARVERLYEEVVAR